MSGWVRLWHDMPTDPKWRVIAKRSGRSISEVMSVFTFMMVNASANASERGRTHNLFAEDIAAALDVETDNIEAIIEAMEGKVVENGVLLGWEKRQPKREDNSAERAKRWREERKRTQANARERPDIDIDSEIDKKEPNGSLSEKPKAKRATALPKNWKPELTEAMQAMVSQWPDGELQRQIESFRDHAVANGRTAKDWQAAFRTWARKADEWRKQNGQSNRNPQQRGNHQPAQHNGYLLAALERKSGASNQRYDESGGWPEDS